LIGLARGASERSAYRLGVNAVEAYRETQEQAPGVLGNTVAPFISGEKALEGEIKGLKALTAELEAALVGKAGGQRRVTCRTVQKVAAALPDGRDRAALRGEQLASDRVKARQNRLIISTGPSSILEGML
jgi:hypothetical protein